MTEQTPKAQILEQLSLVAKALGHPLRLELLEYAAQGERSVETLASLSGQSVANTSHHLQLLRRAGLLSNRKAAQQVLYTISGDDVTDLIGSHAELQSRAQDGTVTVLDVRPADEFASGHLPGAVNMSVQDLEHHLDALPKDREVVAYCRGAYCVLSFEAVAHLRKQGYTARRLEDGYPEWKAAGLPVEH